IGLRQRVGRRRDPRIRQHTDGLDRYMSRRGFNLRLEMYSDNDYHKYFLPEAIRSCPRIRGMKLMTMTRIHPSNPRISSDRTLARTGTNTAIKSSRMQRTMAPQTKGFWTTSLRINREFESRMLNTCQSCARDSVRKETVTASATV